MDTFVPGLESEALAAVELLGSLKTRLVSLAKALPGDPETARVLRQLGVSASPPKDPPADFLEGLRRDLMAASRAKRLSDLSGKQQRYAAWLLWNGDKPAAALPGVLEMVLGEARNSCGSLRRLIQAFVRDFDARAVGIGEAARCIQQALKASNDPRVENWRLAQKEVQLFEPAGGPQKLASALFGNDPAVVLSRYRLDDPILAASRYMMAVEDTIRTAAPEMLRDGGTRALEHIVKILAPDRRLRFPARRAETARAFLGAWFTGRGEPAPALQEPVRRLLLNWVGDPRLNQQRWSEVGEKGTALMRRWLARASLDLFFRLIDQQHPSGSHWPYRRAFWFAYLEKGVITDAWLALGTDAYNSATAVRELGNLCKSGLPIVYDVHWGS
jgi:hypothetical protein